MDTGGSHKGGIGQSLTEFDARLSEVVTAWATLPDAIKIGIVAMVKATICGR